MENNKGFLEIKESQNKQKKISKKVGSKAEEVSHKVGWGGEINYRREKIRKIIITESSDQELAPTSN